MIHFKLNDVLESRGWTMYKLSNMTGIRPNTISQWVNDERLIKEGKGVKSINRETLEAICEVLECNVGDILEFRK